MSFGLRRQSGGPTTLYLGREIEFEAAKAASRFACRCDQ